MSTIEQLLAARQRADLLKTAAEQPALAATAAKTELAKRETAFADDPTPTNAQAALEAREQFTEHAHLAAVIESAGGPARTRWRALHTPEVFALLTRGFADREVEIARKLGPARERYGDEVAVLVKGGLQPAWANIANTVVPLRQKVEQLGALAQGALQDRAAAAANRYDRGFDSLFSALVAPLPN
jgi:hypothetical protein